VRMLTDGSGNVVARQDYLPFGEEIPAGYAGRSSSLLFGASDGVEQKFTGQIRDSETGMDFFPARYYASALGRFMSPDPANAGADPTDPQSWNAYAYVRNNPLALVDPMGLCTFDAEGNAVEDENGACYEGGFGGSVTVVAQAPPDVMPIFVSLPSLLSGTQQPAPTAPPPAVREAGAGVRPTETETKQTFSQCMAAHANGFSIAGTINHGFNAIFGTTSLAFENNFFAQAVFGNPITTVLYGSAIDNAGTALSLGPTFVQKGMGTVTSYGRRTTTIMALNLVGKGGVPLALGASSAGTKVTIGRVASVAGGFMSLEVSVAVNVGFTAAEAAYCASQP